MTRFVVDCGVVLHLASEAGERVREHELLAPTLLRSQTLSALHEAVHRGELPPDVALDRLNRIWAMRSACSATPCSAETPGTSRSGWAGPRPTTPSTSHSRSYRQTRSSPWTRSL